MNYSVRIIFLKNSSLLVAALIYYSMMGVSATSGKYPIYCENSVMRDKAHGTCEKGVMPNLRWKCNRELADRICCFNRLNTNFAVIFQFISLD